MNNHKKEHKEQSNYQSNYVDSLTPQERAQQKELQRTVITSTSEHKEGCCERCASTDVGGEGVCWDEGCPCHKEEKTITEGWEKEFDRRFLEFIVNDESLPYIRIKSFIRQLISSKRQRIVEKGCPPHNFIPCQYEGSWGGSVPPPNMKCTKCLLTERF